MFVLKKLRFLIALGIVVYALTFAFVVAFTYLQDLLEPEEIASADMIIVLGAGMDADGTLHNSSKMRVQQGVALFKRGVAPRIHFTGGMGKPAGPGAGAQMAALAQSLGVPATATSSENRSQSTLQNALFSKPAFKDAKRIVLVSEGFHLARSYASFKVFGAKDIALSNSEPFRGGTQSKPYWGLTMTVREAFAIWFNAGRLVIWWIAGVIPLDGRDELLV